MDMSIPPKESISSTEKSKTSLMPINSWGADFSYRELMWIFNETINRGLERSYLWDEKTANNYIQSILLGIPLTGLYFIVINDMKLFVDGYQRIATLHHFTHGQRPRQFGLEQDKNKQSQIRFFTDLSCDDKEKILNLSLHGIVLNVNDTYAAVEFFKRIRYIDSHFSDSEIELYIKRILRN